MRVMQVLPLVLPLLSPLAVAQATISLQSDWIDLVKGSKGKKMGVEVQDVQPGDTPGTRRVFIAVPKVAMGHPEGIEEVRVVGRAPEESKPLDIQYKWVYDYDDDNYGLIVQLGEGNWPIRLYMNAGPGYLHPE